jgi:ligand-binding SRPBCC domain-containing protein
MTTVRESTRIHAPIDRLFQLSTHLALVQETLGMQPVDTGVANGITSGNIVANSRVVWRGWKFGLPTQHHTLITGYESPHPSTDHDHTAEAFFQDTQERGRFAFFQHDHHFYESLDLATNTRLTELRDQVRFALPFGPLGALAARLILAPYIHRLCRKRFARLKSLAESEAWHPFVEPASP